MPANASDRHAKKVVEKAIVDKGLGKKRDQYFIFMVALDAAASFVLFRAECFFFFGRTFDLVSGQQCICACTVPHPLCT